MAAPVVTFAPAAPVSGGTVTVTVVRDVPKYTITVTATTAGGAGSAPVPIVETLAVSCNPARALTVVSDDGTTAVYSFVA